MVENVISEAVPVSDIAGRVALLVVVDSVVLVVVLACCVMLATVHFVLLVSNSAEVTVLNAGVNSEMLSSGIMGIMTFIELVVPAVDSASPFLDAML